MVCGYLQTVFAAPQFWWWGKSVPSVALFGWSLWLGLLIIVSLLITGNTQRGAPRTTSETICFFCLALASLNVAWVQFFLADSPEYSYRYADIFWKTSLLLFLFYRSIRNMDDLMLILNAIFIGCASIGYQVVAGKQGYVHKGRLEGIAIPGASDSNLISGILLMGLLIGGYLVLTIPGVWKKALYIAGSVLILETILRNNSRGCYLGLIASGLVFLVFSSGRARKYAAIGGLLGVVAIFLMAKNQGIWDRFYSTFAEEEERDGSAQSRLDYWTAAIDMISSYPLGSGGEAAFMSPRGMSFISHITNAPRAVHNGFLDIAASWGVQGFILFFIVTILSLGTVLTTSRRSKQSDDLQTHLLCALLLSMAIGQLVIALFLSSLDCEMPLISLALCLVSWRVYSNQRLDLLSEDDPTEDFIQERQPSWIEQDYENEMTEPLSAS